MSRDVAYLILAEPVTHWRATQIAQLRRTVTRSGKKTVEVVYLIISADHHQPPSRPGCKATAASRTGSYWVHNVTYDEGRSQVRTGYSPHVMATLRNTAVSLLGLTGV